MPADTHRRYLVATAPVSHDKTLAIPNSINLDLVDLAPNATREPYSLIWSSSPDRGLHVALDIFLKVRERVQAATLKIYYRFRPWYESVRDSSGPVGDRARRIGEVFDKYGSNGESGIQLY